MSNLDLPNLFTNSYQTIVEYADLAVVDLSKISTPEGKAELVVLVREAMRTLGFLCIVNHGMSSEQVNSRRLLLEVSHSLFSQNIERPSF